MNSKAWLSMASSGNWLWRFARGCGLWQGVKGPKGLKGHKDPKRIGWRYLLGAIFLGLTACRSTPALNTASGRPEVIIQGKSAPEILQTAREFFVHRGYSMMPSDNLQKLVFDRRTEKPGAKASASNCWRVRLAVIDLTNGAHRLSGMPCKVANCGGELESEWVMPVSFPQIQALLEEIKAQLQAHK